MYIIIIIIINIFYLLRRAALIVQEQCQRVEMAIPGCPSAIEAYRVSVDVNLLDPCSRIGLGLSQNEPTSEDCDKLSIT